jgi:arylsulfatase A-like enzyme
MHRFLILIIGLVITSCQSHQSAKKQLNRPNILLIMTDDQGYGDLGFHGNPDIQTPVLDAFAKKSIRFLNFYVSPVCAPTRASLMTGRYSLRTGVMDTYNGWAMMATEEKTIAEILKQNGYQTAVCGKWHLGDTYASRPQDQGFDYSLIHHGGGMHQVGDLDTWYRGDSAYFDPILTENGKKVKKSGYCSDVFTDAAIDFIEVQKDNPFFCYLSFNAPHTPLQLPEEYDSMYTDLQIDSMDYPHSGRAFPNMSESDLEAARKVYGMVSNIDDNVGRLLQKLDQLGKTDNTIVIFMTDNGPQQRRFVGGFRGLKGSVYEGGIHVPFIMRYPKAFKSEQEIKVTAAHFDVLPTLLELCQISAPKNLDGKSLVSAMQGASPPWIGRPLFFHWQRGFPEPYRNIAVRKGDYKLVGHTGHLASTGDFELFDLSTDPSETRNIVNQNQTKAEELKRVLDDWYTEIIQSPNLDNVPIIVGSTSENPVVMTRNDAKGAFGIWAQQEINGYWDIQVAQDGYYQITSSFEKPVTSNGNAIIRLGNIQRSTEIHEGSQKAVHENIWIEKGKYRVEAGFRNYQTWRIEFPFYITFKRVENTDKSKEND